MSDNRIEQISAQTYVGDYGQMVQSLTLVFTDTAPQVAPADLRLQGCYTDISGHLPSKGVMKVEQNGRTLQLIVDPFLYRFDFALCGVGSAAGLSFRKPDITKIEVAGESLFSAHDENGIRYRLKAPEGQGPRPLVLFLHGGGECGTDNLRQLTGTLGAIELAERLADFYVMAPQAPTGGMTDEERFAKLQSRGDPYRVCLRMKTDNGPLDSGWTRDYLAKVCAQIRSLIAGGQVDPARVYLFGLSMGGAGALKALSVAPDLFAAAVIVCPSMNGESYPIMANLPPVPVYFATSYIDHQPARHAYMYRAMESLRQAGRQDVRFTIFLPEDLEPYGIGVTPDLTEEEQRDENHNSWVLALHNEYGILDWMLSHKK